MSHGGVELHSKQLADFIHRNAAANDQRASGFANYIGRGPAILFTDFADDFFHQIFNGDESGHQSVLVNHNGHLLIFALHILQKLRAEFCFRHEKSRAHEFANSAIGCIAVGDFEHVASHDDADDVVQRFFKYGQARKLRINDQFAEFFERGGDAYGDYVGARSHYFADALIAKLDHLFDEARFVLLDDSLFGGGVDKIFDGLLLGCGRALFVLGKVKHGNEELENGQHGPGEEYKCADKRNDRRDPVAGRASQ